MPRPFIARPVAAVEVAYVLSTFVSGPVRELLRGPETGTLMATLRKKVSAPQPCIDVLRVERCLKDRPDLRDDLCLPFPAAPAEAGRNRQEAAASRGMRSPYYVECNY